MNDEESNSTESIYILDYTKVYIHDEMTQTNKLTLISCEETEHPLWDEFRLIEELVCNSSYKQSKNGRSHICLITEKRGTYINNFAVINSVLQTLSSCFLLRKDLFSENQYLSDEINLIADILNNMEEEKYSVDFSVFKIFTQSISPSLILRNILNPEVFGFDFNVGSQTFSETVSRLKTDETIEDFIKNNNRYNPKAFIIFKLDRYNNDEYTFPMYLEFKDDTFYYYFYLQAVTTKHGESYKTYTRYLCGKKFVSYQKIYLSPNSISDPKLQIQDDYDAKRSQLCLYFCFKSKHNENIEQNHDNSNQDTNANNHNDADEVKDSGDNNDADDNNDEDDSNDEDEGNYSDTDDYNDMDAEINDDINSEIGDERPYNEMNSENATEVNEIQLNDMLNNLPKLHFDHLNRSPCYFSDQELQEILNFLIRNNNVPQQTKISYSAIAKKLQLGYWTIYRWSKKLLQDREYNPKINIRSKQKMTPELESIILFIIQYHYIEEGFYINSFILKNIALRCSIEFEDLMLKDGFTASDQWCRTFRNKFDIVFRAMHANRGCSPDNLSEEEIKKFQALKESLIIQHSEDPYISHLINIDETKWWEHPKFGLTFAFKGAKRVVYKKFDEKACLTAIATVTSKGNKLPLVLLVETENEMNNIKKDFPTVNVFYSSSGWSDENSMTKYLQIVREFYNKFYSQQSIEAQNYYKEHYQIDLVYDSFPSHVSAIEVAKRLGFNIHLVPVGATGRCQPLDQNVFGALKGLANTLYWNKFLKNRNSPLNRINSIRILYDAWDLVSEKTITMGWEVYDQIVNESKYDHTSIFNDLVNKYGDIYIYERIMNINSKFLEQDDENTDKYILNPSRNYSHPVEKIVNNLIFIQKTGLMENHETVHECWSDFHDRQLEISTIKLHGETSLKTFITLLLPAPNTYSTNFSTLTSCLYNLVSCFYSGANCSLFLKDDELLNLKECFKEHLECMTGHCYGCNFDSIKKFDKIISPSLILRNILNPEVFGFDFNVGSQTFSETVSRLKTDETIEDFIKNNNRYNPKAFIIFKLDRYNNDEYTFPMYLEFKDDTFYYYFYLQAVTTKHGESYKTYTRYLCGKKFVTYKNIFVRPDKTKFDLPRLNDTYPSSHSYIALYFCFKLPHKQNAQSVSPQTRVQLQANQTTQSVSPQTRVQLQANQTTQSVSPQTRVQLQANQSARSDLDIRINLSFIRVLDNSIMTGLENDSYICFAIALIQVLLHIKPFMDIIDKNLNNIICQQISNIAKKVKAKQKHATEEITKILQQFGMASTQNTYQDTYELFCEMINSLSEINEIDHMFRINEETSDASVFCAEILLTVSNPCFCANNLQMQLFPCILTICLEWNYTPEYNSMDKIFPYEITKNEVHYILFGIIVHQGDRSPHQLDDHYDSHYVSFIRQKNANANIQIVKFDDSRVTVLTERTASLQITKKAGGRFLLFYFKID
ncbi:Clan CA, family C19, ubiquitin hydrolase-like cysteine peptidase [Trichomonas vaginalis G3]|uniref:Clan CA, family C19, ubiquitin hydrolase-like cysteine peptidase n=1 Tax=Trichomonas vaginalis (strain ATCC PRA-98 / G3) TaxID=412133 RepID=A2DJS7_TRIV3|nr:Clan CA, family C19, ubiquitin hydrolase-like cysteine peptidase [Trichomonas vaginalis G3]|eukprot:XP_001580277.1 Clan CA, family C19, ubiquitin hydrolase-like cysteine peptidase [Trichomonas vaginalis G3]